MNSFAAEKFGTDNASCEQRPISLEHLNDIAEMTLKKQSLGDAVHEEEGDMEEVEEPRTDDWGDEQPFNPGEMDYEAQHKREYGEDFHGNPVDYGDDEDEDEKNF
ncbi:MAG TPA: hypothetical protein VMW95_05925 [Desulfobacterales bacterium]|nr:hypothetical protein [Desulfobacterales bacterium]